MSLKDLVIYDEYKSFVNDIAKEFYTPVLKNAIAYDRAVGFFSSTSLKEITRGLAGLIDNGGRVRIITSPRLSSEDIEAISKGYENKEKIIENRINNIFEENLSLFDKKRLTLLANLIAKGILDIKIAFIQNENSIGIFHDKMGIVQDSEENVIAFTGSLNETGSAFNHNYESIEVYKSWTHDMSRVKSKQETFDRLWKNEAKNIETLDFPKAIKEKLTEYESDELDLDIDDREEYEIRKTLTEKYVIEGPVLPNSYKLRDYQKSAIKNWANSGYQGIFDMATGTGKTVTGLAAAAKLAEDLSYNLAVIIVCPYQHLVEQWVEDIEAFNMNPIIGHSASVQRKWKNRLEDQVEAYNLEVIDHFCFVTTNATFSSPFVQEQLMNVQRDFLLIVDEAHNFGASHLRTKLLANAKYRLALSATLERHNDEEGTEALYSYFGKKNIEYTLEMAIDSDMLTPYKYYPIPVFLTPEELEKYIDLTKKISKYLKKDRYGKVSIGEGAKFLLLERARVVAGAQQKVEALESAIKKYDNDSHILVYCGATTISDPGYEEGNVDQLEKRQIDIVTQRLAKNLDMKVSQFTSNETAKEREVIKETFQEGKNLQALVAIRCLDEGVNIPSIKTAFILASSTNPKEYVQRRGRVLRKSPGKQYAEIYDFITLPIPFENVGDLDQDEINSIKGLPRREMERLKDFASIAQNTSLSNELINEIEEAYQLNLLEDENEI